MKQFENSIESNASQAGRYQCFGRAVEENERERLLTVAAYRRRPMGMPCLRNYRELFRTALRSFPKSNGQLLSETRRIKRGVYRMLDMVRGMQNCAAALHHLHAIHTLKRIACYPPSEQQSCWSENWKLLARVALNQFWINPKVKVSRLARVTFMSCGFLSSQPKVAPSLRLSLGIAFLFWLSDIVFSKRHWN